jgi:hypothetical protein
MICVQASTVTYIAQLELRGMDKYCNRTVSYVESESYVDPTHFMVESTLFELRPLIFICDIIYDYIYYVECSRSCTQCIRYKNVVIVVITTY